jgi:hypothetical protein
MKITLIAALGLLALQSCAHTKEETPVCSAEYRPTLCLVQIDGDTYGGYGANECIARQKLASRLKRAKVNAPADAVQCGRVLE